MESLRDEENETVNKIQKYDNNEYGRKRETQSDSCKRNQKEKENKIEEDKTCEIN